MSLNEHQETWRKRVEFCERHLPSFKSINYRADNYGDLRVEMFTVLTQHIQGLSVTELIDEGLKQEKELRNKMEIAGWKRLP